MDNDQDLVESPEAKVSGRKRIAERDLKSNEKYWRDELMKHAAASMITFIVICGYFAPFPEDIATKVNSVPVARLFLRCVAMWAFGVAIIPWGVHHGIRIRYTKFNDDAYEYDTVPSKTFARGSFIVLGVLAYLVLATRAGFDVSAHDDIWLMVKIVFWFVVTAGIAAIIVSGFGPKMEREQENENDKSPSHT